MHSFPPPPGFKQDQELPKTPENAAKTSKDNTTSTSKSSRRPGPAAIQLDVPALPPGPLSEVRVLHSPGSRVTSPGPSRRGGPAFESRNTADNSRLSPAPQSFPPPPLAPTDGLILIPFRLFPLGALQPISAQQGYTYVPPPTTVNIASPFIVPSILQSLPSAVWVNRRARFSNSFTSERLSDAKPSLPLQPFPNAGPLFKGALPSGSPHPALDSGVEWYKARAEDIPGCVSCQFCCEDVVLTNRLSTCIEPQVPQHPNSIRNLGEGAAGYGPVPGAQERLGVAEVMVRSPHRAGHRRLLRRVLQRRGAPQGRGAQVAAGGRARAGSSDSRCAAHGAPNIRFLVSRCGHLGTFSTFWCVLDMLIHERFCGKTGVTNGAWYTLLADPPGFHIRRTYYLAAAEPLVRASLAVSGFARRAARPNPRDEHCQQSLNVGSSHDYNSVMMQEITMPSAYK
ncbi:hypothetical protein DL765_004010 [Monosporascus sp. GIB2]|nr:hypothetical protein DL765_004010 [Monosporascus sp. GIB2]